MRYCVLSVFRCGQTIKVLSTDPSQALPARDGGAEVANSSLGQLREWSLCVRFLTFSFSSLPDRLGQVSHSAPLQVSISNKGGLT